MPTPNLRSLAKQSGKSIETLEKYWDKAKKLAAEAGHKDNYDYITGITKRMAGISSKESYSKKSSKREKNYKRYNEMNLRHIKKAQKLIQMAESYQSMFYKFQEENYGQLQALVKNLLRLYPIEKLWVKETTYGILIKAIVVKQDQREQGVGTDVMNALIEYSDLVQKPIALTPSKQYGGTVNRLIDWYKGLGFILNNGKNRDFRFPETMVRYPQKIGVSKN